MTQRLPPLIRSTATFDETYPNLYRYDLVRTWTADAPYLAVIGLNPSTATAIYNDPTVRRCMGYALTWGYAGLVMLNLFALRSTDPKALRRAADPVGPGNDAAILRHVQHVHCGLVLAAWGHHGTYAARDAFVVTLLQAAGVPLHVLGLNRDGLPLHPLYQSATRTPQPWPAGVIH